MPLTLTYGGDTSVPVEIENFTPEWARDKSTADIERFEIFHGNRRIPLAEMFSVSGSANDECFEFQGNLSGVHWIGAHMTRGSIRIHGAAGRHLGSEMAGGTIEVHGDAGGWVGSEMRAGHIHVHGNAGHLVGSAYRGSAKGMCGGTILIDGNVGNETGHTMRRGLIAVGGTSGDLAGFNMLAGSLLIFGECGIRVGAGMRRGTIGLFGPNPPPMLPTFRYASTFRPTVLRILLNELQSSGFRFDESLLDADVDLFSGDLVALGRGEILRRSAQN